MSITFYCIPFETRPAWDLFYFGEFYHSSIRLGPFHAAFGQIPNNATLSVTILPDNETLEISRLLPLYQERVQPLPGPPTSSLDLHVGAKIKQWEEMYFASKRDIMPAVRILIKKLMGEGGYQCLARMRQHEEECKELSIFVTPLPPDFAEGQLLAKLSLVYRIQTGFSRVCESQVCLYEMASQCALFQGSGNHVDPPSNLDQRHMYLVG